jgi:hypothetical protein
VFAFRTGPCVGQRHVEIDAGELGLTLEWLDLRAAHRRLRWYRTPHERAQEMQCVGDAMHAQNDDKMRVSM